VMAEVRLIPPVMVCAELITVVPSHNLTFIEEEPVLSLQVTVPTTNHVPTVPCATLGPSK
jgi:hypothetical protein